MQRDLGPMPNPRTDVDDTSSRACVERRDFLARSLALVAGATGAAAAWQLASPAPALAAKKRSDSAHGRLTITDIEAHDITLEFDDWNAYQLMHYYGPWKRTIYIVHTNAGLTGLGESGSRASDDIIQKYIGTSPWDWVGDETSLGLGTAMYDLMGKAAQVPAYKLFGQAYRKWVPVSAWTVSTQPKRMAEAVQRHSARGFTWLKFHLSPFENIFDQLEAMQAVAPKGFRLHFDFTMCGTVDHMFEVLEKMSNYPISGCFEDPLEPRDLEGYVDLRARTRLPVVLHHSPMGATHEILRRAADAYMLGHANIGVARRRAGLFAAAQIPFMLQNVGGAITRSMTTHMQAAFKTASFHFISAGEIFKSDVTNEKLDPVNGLVRVSEKPGLGVTLDRDELNRLKNLPPPPAPRWIVRTRYANGTMMYNLHDPDDSLFMVRPDRRRLFPVSFDAPVTTDYWDDDGSAAFKAMFERLEREKAVIERGGAR